MERRRLLIFGGSLTLNILISWTILPFALPPFQGYTLMDLVEVILWQGIGTISWPLALVGGLFSIFFGGNLSNSGPFLLLLTYPAMLFLFIRAVVAKDLRRWELPLLDLLLTFSFAAVWYGVLNDYGFMVG